MNSAQKIELTLRAAMLMKEASKLVGCQNVEVAKMVMAVILQQTREIRLALESPEFTITKK